MGAHAGRSALQTVDLAPVASTHDDDDGRLLSWHGVEQIGPEWISWRANQLKFLKTCSIRRNNLFLWACVWFRGCSVASRAILKIHESPSSWETTAQQRRQCKVYWAKRGVPRFRRPPCCDRSGQWRFGHPTWPLSWPSSLVYLLVQSCSFGSRCSSQLNSALPAAIIQRQQFSILWKLNRRVEIIIISWNKNSFLKLGSA